MFGSSLFLSIRLPSCSWQADFVIVQMYSQAYAVWLPSQKNVHKYCYSMKPQQGVLLCFYVLLIRFEVHK